MGGVEETQTRGRRRLRAGLLSKLALTLVIAGVPGLIGLSLLALQSEEAMLKQTLVNDRLREITQNRARALGQVLRNAAADVRLLGALNSVEELASELASGRPPGEAGATAKVVHDFERLVQSRSVYYEIEFVDSAGRPVVGVYHAGGETRVVSEPVEDLHFEPLLSHIRPGDLYVSRAAPNRVQDVIETPIRPMVEYVCGVRGPSGATAGLAVLKMELTPVLSGVAAPDLWSQTVVVDRDGFYVAHPQPERAWGGPQDLGTGYRLQSDLPEPALQGLLGPIGGMVSADGSTYVAQRVLAPGGPEASLLVISSAVDEQVLGPALTGLRRRITLLATISFVLPLLAGMVLVAFFLRPVPKLQAAVRAVAEGDLSHRVDIRSADEMEDLADDFNDMAARLEDYGRLERTMELEKLRDDLIHMIVHDLRTPLTSIISSLRTVERVDADPEVTRELLPYCLTAGNSLMTMINDLLDINRMESGVLELYPEQVDVPEVVSDALEVLRALADEHSVILEQTVQEGVEPITADRDKVERILTNLVGNGIKFTPSGGRVAVDVGRDDVDGGVHIRVIDSGVGIPKEYQERIFDKFGQVESRKSARLVSTGLGLTFCKLAAEAHGGRIWVESEVGEGSTFHVHLPATPACSWPLTGPQGQ
ncbi:MAG: ATP-binding protein [Armatimonadota bacterium]